MPAKRKYPRVCRVCFRRYQAFRHDSTTCSVSCRSAASRISTQWRWYLDGYIHRFGDTCSAYQPHDPDPLDRIRCWNFRHWLNYHDGWFEIKRGESNPAGHHASPTYLLDRRKTVWLPRQPWESEKTNPGPLVNPTRDAYQGWEALKSRAEIGLPPGDKPLPWWDESQARTEQLHELLIAIRDVDLKIELN